MNKAVATAASSGAAIIAARVLGPGGRGQLALEVTLVTLAMGLLATSVAIAGRLHLVGDDPTSPDHYFGLGAVVVVLQTGVCAVIALVLLPLAGVPRSSALVLGPMLFGAVLVAAYISTNALYAYGRFVQAGILDSGSSVVTLVASVGLLAADVRTVSWYLAAFTAGSLAELLAGVWFHRRNNLRIRPRVDRAAWRTLLRTGVPATGLGVAQSATYRLDRYLVGLFLTPSFVGVYAVAGTITELLRLVPFAVSQVLLHRVAANLLTERFQQRVHTLTVALTALEITLLGLLAPVIVPAVFGRAYLGAVTPLRILLVGELAVSSFLIDSSTLMGRRRPGAAAQAAVLALVVVTALDLALIPAFQLAGAAWASVVGYWAMATLARYRVRHGREVPSQQAAP
ncbi:MAG: polysaccharide biosynthesis C-terminal domain-containing protein [Acidimicrobiales bacterium]